MTWQWVTLILGLCFFGVVLISVSILEKTTVSRGPIFGRTIVTRFGAREGVRDGINE